MPTNPFSVPVTPDWRGLLRCIRREGMPARVHYIELFLDWEIQEEICKRYGVLEGLDPADPWFQMARTAAVQRFLGYDFVRYGMDGLDMPLKHIQTQDTAALQRAGGRSYMEEHRGPITNWDEFESYPWPDPEKASTAGLEWLSENLPEDMCIIGSGGFAHFAEHLTWLMGYESLCYALYDQRDLVKAMSDRLLAMYRVVLRRMLRFDRVKVIWGSDDMGFKTGPLISPQDMREFVLPGHKLMAEMSHAAGRPYILHSCGNLATIMADLIDDVGIDARHSFEDVIETVTHAKRKYGKRIALLGGIDVDFLCRATEKQVRRRVRETLKKCMAGGGYCLGSGNSVANYVPVDNYLAMLDEGRKFRIGA
jgi:uroporphyrinogen decarboxylase